MEISDSDICAAEADKQAIKTLLDDAKLMFPNVDPYLLWVSTVDYYFVEVLKQDVKESEEMKELMKKADEEFKNVNYNTVTIQD